MSKKHACARMWPRMHTSTGISAQELGTPGGGATSPSCGQHRTAARPGVRRMHLAKGTYTLAACSLDHSMQLLTPPQLHAALSARIAVLAQQRCPCIHPPAPKNTMLVRRVTRVCTLQRESYEQPTQQPSRCLMVPPPPALPRLPCTLLLHLRPHGRALCNSAVLHRGWALCSPLALHAAAPTQHSAWQPPRPSP